MSDEDREKEVKRKPGETEEKGKKDKDKKRKPKFSIEKLEEREIPDDVALHSTNNQI